MSGAVTDLKVQLDIESAKFRSELDKVTKSIDTVSGKLQRIGDKVGGSASNVLKGVASWDLLSGAIARAGQFLAHGLKEYSDAEQASLRLSSALSQLGYNADELLGPLEAQSKHFERVTLFTQEQAAQVQQLLLQYGVAPSEIEKTTAAILDYSAATGADAAGATETLLKAVNAGKDGVKGLGVTYVSTGSKAKDLGIAVEQLTSKFNGSAEAAAGGLTGSLDKLKTAADDLAEAFGGFLAGLDAKLGVLTYFTDKLESAAKILDNMQREKDVSAVTKMADEAVRLKDELTEVERLLAQVADDQAAGEDTSGKIYTTKSGGKITEQGLLKTQDRLIKALEDLDASLTKGVKGYFSGNSKTITTGASKKATDANKAVGEVHEDTRKGMLAGFAKVREEMEAEGKKLAESLRTPLEVFNDAKKSFDDQLAQGTISQETYERAVADATETYEKATTPAKTLAEAFAKIDDELTAEGNKITEALRTPLEVFKAEIDKLATMRDTGHISDETFKRGSMKAKKELDGHRIPNELDKLGNALAAAGESFVGGLGEVGDLIGSIVNGARDGGVWGALLAAFMEIAKKTESALKFLGFAMEFVEQLSVMIEPLVKPIFDALKDLLGGIISMIGPLFVALQPLFDAIAKLIENLGPVLSSIGYLLEALGPVIEVIGKIVGVIVDVLKPIFELIGFVIRLVATVVLGIIIALNEIAAAFGDTKARAEADRLKALVDRMWDPNAAATEEANREAAEATMENAAAQKEAANAANEAANALYNLPSGYKIEAARFAAASAQDSMTVPAFAEGGVVSKATLAMVGEGGERELIAPESMLRKVMREEGGRGASVNVQIVSNDAELIWKKIKKLMERDRFNMTGEIVGAY